MKILKCLLMIVTAPVILVLTLFVWLCTGLIYISGLVFDCSELPAHLHFPGTHILRFLLKRLRLHDHLANGKDTLYKSSLHQKKNRMCNELPEK